MGTPLEPAAARPRFIYTHPKLRAENRSCL